MRLVTVVLGLLVLAGIVGIHRAVLQAKWAAEDAREVCSLVSQQCIPCQSACTPCDPSAGEVLPVR